MAFYLMLLGLLSGYSISGPIDSSTLSASQTTPKSELSCKCIQVGATKFDDCVWDMQALGFFGIKQLIQPDLREDVLNGTSRISRGKTVEDFIQGSTTNTTSLDLGTNSTIAATTYPYSVPTTFSTATISSMSSADTVDLGRRGNTDWAFVCYKVGGQTPDKFATTFCQNQYRYLCDDQGRLQKTTFDDFCENICGCVSLASGKFRWGTLCKASIMGPICAAVSDSVDTIDTVDTADTIDFGARDTTDWAMASSTVVQEAALARRQASSGALERRYNYAFICYHVDVTPE